MEELLVRAILADRAREAASVRHNLDAIQASSDAELWVAAQTQTTRFRSVNWLCQSAAARR